MSKRTVTILGLLAAAVLVVWGVAGGVWWVNTHKKPTGVGGGKNVAGSSVVTVQKTTPPVASPPTGNTATPPPAETPPASSDSDDNSTGAAPGGDLGGEHGWAGDDEAAMAAIEKAPAGGLIPTIEGGKMRLPKDMNGKQWSVHVENALEVVEKAIPVMFSVVEEYPDPYAGYRKAYKDGLITKKLLGELTRNEVSAPDQKDWEDFAKIGVFVDARLDDASPMLDFSVEASSKRVIMFAGYRMDMHDKSGPVRSDYTTRRFTVIRDRNGKYRVDEAEEGTINDFPPTQ